MNLQEAKAKTAKPRTIADLLLVLSVVLTVLSALPYTLGEVATVIPPAAKGYLVVVGIVASTILGAIRPYLPSPNKPEDQPPAPSP